MLITETNLWVVVAVDFGERGEEVTGVLGEVLKALQRSNARMKDRDDDSVNVQCWDGMGWNRMVCLMAHQKQVSRLKQRASLETF